MSKPGIPKGTRDFSTAQVVKRNFIFDHIRSVFRKYGFQPIETPAMENLSTLTGKYGEEGDRLVFKVLNNGDFLAKADDGALSAKNSNALLPSIAKRGLRYDLTVPFARYVVMNQNDLSFPFKRYQIQPVWRADRPQRGRYQEFFQCDVDVIGSNSLLYEGELIQIYDEVFSNLKVPVKIKVNNRKILLGIAEYAGIEDRFVDMTVIIDKLDKIGLEGVKNELERKEFSTASIEKILQLLAIKDIPELAPFLESSEIGKKGIEEIQAAFKYAYKKALTNEVNFDVTLARGLNYYTGCIFEVAAIGVEIGSIGGGGRYDDLTGVFGLKNMSGVGISFGAERIFIVMDELDLFPESIENQLQVLLIAFDEESHDYACDCLIKLRAASIVADLYPEPVKMQKQMKYANARQVPYTILIGSEEVNSGLLTLKNMDSGEQSKVDILSIIEQLS